MTVPTDNEQMDMASVLRLLELWKELVSRLETQVKGLKHAQEDLREDVFQAVRVAYRLGAVEWAREKHPLCAAAIERDEPPGTVPPTTISVEREAQLVAERDAALRACAKWAREAGLAKGKLEMSEAAGIVDMWKDENARLRKELQELKKGRYRAAQEVARERLKTKRDKKVKRERRTIKSLGLEKYVVETSIDTIDFSVRAKNILLNIGVKTIGDLVKLRRIDLLRTLNCGVRTVEEIENELCFLGLGLADEVQV